MSSIVLEGCHIFSKKFCHLGLCVSENVQNSSIPGRCGFSWTKERLKGKVMCRIMYILHMSISSFIQSLFGYFLDPVFPIFLPGVVVDGNMLVGTDWKKPGDEMAANDLTVVNCLACLQ